MSLLTCRKIAVLKFTVFVLHEQKPKGVGAHFSSSEKASSVPGRMHTAVVESYGAANPRVPVLNLTVLSFSPTLAGRDLTWWRLKSHMAEELPCREAPVLSFYQNRHRIPIAHGIASRCAGATSQLTYRCSSRRSF